VRKPGLLKDNAEKGVSDIIFKKPAYGAYFRRIRQNPEIETSEILRGRPAPGHSRRVDIDARFGRSGRSRI
jgi:hypothetical protein